MPNSEENKNQESDKEEVIDTFHKPEQEIIQKGEKKKKESILNPGQLPPDEEEPHPEDEDEEDDGFLSKISGFFSEIGVSLSSIISIIVLIVIIIGTIYGLYYAYQRFFTTPEEEPPQDQEIPQDLGPDITSSYILGKDEISPRIEEDPQIGISYIIGQNEALFNVFGLSQIETSYLLGQESGQLLKDFAKWIKILSDMKNAYETNLDQLLDNSNSRTQALDDHLTDLSAIDQESDEALTQINETSDKLEISLNRAAERSEILENDFFTAVDALQGQRAETLLDQFINIAKVETEVRARFSALSRLRLIYEGFGADFKRRILDIEFNKEALIKDVQVFDVENSTLNLVIPLDVENEL